MRSILSAFHCQNNTIVESEIHLNALLTARRPAVPTVLDKCTRPCITDKTLCLGCLSSAKKLLIDDKNRLYKNTNYVCN